MSQKLIRTSKDTKNEKRKIKSVLITSLGRDLILDMFNPLQLIKKFFASSKIRKLEGLSQYKRCKI